CFAHVPPVVVAVERELRVTGGAAAFEYRAVHMGCGEHPVSGGCVGRPIGVEIGDGQGGQRGIDATERVPPEVLVVRRVGRDIPQVGGELRVPFDGLAFKGLVAHGFTKDCGDRRWISACRWWECARIRDRAWCGHETGMRPRWCTTSRAPDNAPG